MVGLLAPTAKRLIVLIFLNIQGEFQWRQDTVVNIKHFFIDLYI